MRRTLALILAATALPLVAAPVASRPPAATQTPDQAFEALGNAYIDSIARFSPTSATSLGDHSGDARIDDLSAQGRADAVAADRAMLATLAGIDRKALSRDNQVDAALLRNALEYDIWGLEVQQGWAWDPQVYNDVAGGALYSLAARDYAPWADRLKAATARMQAIPALLAQARAQLDPARVPKIHAETVAKQNGGIVQIAEDMLAPHKGDLAPADQAKFDAALATLKAAVAEHQTWLDTVLVPGAKGDFRLGAAKYDQKMRFSLLSTITRAQLKAKAEQAVIDTRAEMYALARQVLAGKAGAPPTPDKPTQDQQQAAIEAALEQSYASRPARAGLMDKAKATLAAATDFVRARGLVTVPDAPVRIITMPKFQQGVAVAYCDPPGPLERDMPTFYAISPIPDEWSDEQATSFLREYNDYMINDLSIHEAMPGHYLQLAHANAGQSPLRAVLWSSPFAEGWAVYAEGMMADEGFLNGDPLFKLTVLKMRLRSITNTLLDIGIHTEGMTRDQAMALMTKTAFQQEREAAGKWVRANLSSVQLLSYYSGYLEQVEMRDEAKRRWGAKFDLKAYNDAVLSHGTPPARFVRELVFDLPIE